jgi:hypothetical protein
VFLLIILAVCFLANFVFFFEDEHLLVILVSMLLCLSLTMITSALGDFTRNNQIEALKLLVRQRLLSMLIQNELEKTGTSLAFLVDELALISSSINDCFPDVIVAECDNFEQVRVQAITNSLLLEAHIDMENSFKTETSEFADEFLDALSSDEE